MYDNYDIEVQLPVNELSSAECQYLEGLLGPEFLLRGLRNESPYAGNSSFPTITVSSGGKIKIGNNRCVSDANGFPCPQIMPEDAYFVIKKVVERLLFRQSVFLPELSFETRYSGMKDVIKVPEEKIMGWINAHRFNFKRLTWFDKLLGRKFPSDNDKAIAERHVLWEIYSNSYYEGFSTLHVFEHHLEPFAKDLATGIALWENEDAKDIVDEIEVPYSLEETLFLSLDKLQVRVWFVRKEPQSQPEKICVSWTAENGHAQSYTGSTCIYHFVSLKDPLEGVELVPEKEGLKIRNSSSNDLWISQRDQVLLEYYSRKEVIKGQP